MPSSNPLSVQLYTFRDVPGPERPALLRALKEAGYGAVEPFGGPEDAAKLRSELDEAGLGVSSMHANPGRDGLPAVAAAARTLGTEIIVVPSLDRDGWGEAGNVRRLAEQVNEVARQAAAEGLRVGYHNHWFEMADIEGRAAIEVFVDALDPDVLLEVDTYWAVVGGQDVVALLRRLGDRARILHLKDGPADRIESDMTALGTGVIQLAAALEAAPAAEWNIVELDRCASDMLTAVRESAAWLFDQGLMERPR